MKRFVSFINRGYLYYKDRGLLPFLGLSAFYLLGGLNALRFLRYRGDLLYIMGQPGSSAEYRCYNMCEELKSYGLTVRVVFQGTPFLSLLTRRFSFFIFQRVRYDDHIAAVIDSIKSQHKSIIFETDDLVYNAKYLHHLDYYGHMTDQEKRYYENGIGREIVEDPYVESCVVSTQFLASSILSDHPDKSVFVLRNRLSSDQLQRAERTLKRSDAIKPNDGKVRIGYFSGSKSHDKDFDLISELLLEFLKSNKDLKLLIVGHLTLDEQFMEVKGQIERFPMVSMQKLMELIIRADINIAPLEVDNPFCNAKSELKYFEAGILNVPTIASATDAFRHAITDGQNGFLADTVLDWKRSLERLIESKELRESVGALARADVIERYTTTSRHRETGLFVDFLNKHREPANRSW